MAALSTRDDGQNQSFLTLISNPFGSMIGGEAFVASLIFSLGMTAIIMILFSILRPYNTVVYAPRAKYADSKHAPPPVGKGLLAWITPLISTKEQDLVDRVGLDAAVFMRFTRMLRNVFLVLSIIGCGVLIPVYLTQREVYTTTDTSSSTSSTSSTSNTKRQATSTQTGAADAWLDKLSPLHMYGSPAYWALVVCAWVFDIVICGFVWWNYRKVFALRRQYFSSTEYQRSLHARTLLLTDIPPDSRSDEGIIRAAESVYPTQTLPRAAIARNVKELPELLEEHEEAVRALEKVLAKYLKNPDKLPEQRPLCKPSKKDRAYTKGQKVDAIEYWTARIKQLELEVKQVRESIDKRNALPYGFASYDSIPEAHRVAYAASKKKQQTGIQLRLAPTPNDLVWKNLKINQKARNWNNFINNVWVTVMTVVWIVPNILIAVFLANLSHLGLYWPAFQNSLNANPRVWAAVQGIASPAITALFYFFLPAIFRRLATSGGDLSKTTRERHVLSKLYSFFVFNNFVVVSVFAALFGWIALLVNNSKNDSDTWDLLLKSHGFTILVNSLGQISPYWLTYQLQRNLGAAIDLAQLVNLAWGSFSRRFLSPTPRQLIELSKPQPFEFASYYNSLLFYATVGLCFSMLQPMILPVTAFYLVIESWMKKYLLLYVYITKYESGGMFWRALINRVLFLTGFSNVVVALIIVAFTVSSLGQNVPNIAMLATLAPLPFVLAAFKFYCLHAFDTGIHYLETGTGKHDLEHAGGETKSRKHDRVGVRFGHPALYQPLMVPMVSSKSQHLLKQIYSGRLDADDARYAAGYSDVYMDQMDATRPGKSNAPAPFEIVNEHEMDFEHYKNRPEFREEGGGNGALFGRAADIVRPGTPGSMSAFSQTDTFASRDDRERSESRHGRNESDDSQSTKVPEGVEYPHGYHKTPNALREHSPAFSDFSADGRPRLNTVESREQLVNSAAAMGHTRVPSRPLGQPVGYGMIRTPGSTPGVTPGEQDMSYEYFRRGRNL